MILNHKYKFIFIKTNKTAGTSLEIALSRFCDSQDIVTPIPPEDEAIRQEFGGYGPNGYVAGLGDYGWADILKSIYKCRPKYRFYNHISARAISRLIDQSTFDSYFKFCFERNPFDKSISNYFWKTKRDAYEPNFFTTSAGLKLLLDQKLKGWDNYTAQGKVIVDEVYRYEDLRSNLAQIKGRLGLPDDLLLPRAKSATRVDKRHYRELLSPRDVEVIKAIFADEITMFNYTY